jgi:predicted outer membrane lipoprotein
MSLNEAPTPTPPIVGGTLFAKYAATLLPALGILFGVLNIILADELIDDTEKGQLIAVVAGLVLTYLLPLLKTWRWAAALKVGASVVAAVATLIIPTFTGGFNANTLLIFGVAVLNALATELGVDMRKDVIDAATPPHAPAAHRVE